MAYQSVNPANGQLLRRFDQHTDEQMQNALATADNTYRRIWSRMPIRDRANLGVQRDAETRHSCPFRPI